MVGVDVKHNNTWKTPTDLHVKHNGVWKNVITTHAKHDGVWKPIFSTPPTAVLNVEARPAATSFMRMMPKNRTGQASDPREAMSAYSMDANHDHSGAYMYYAIHVNAGDVIDATLTRLYTGTGGGFTTYITMFEISDRIEPTDPAFQAVSSSDLYLGRTPVYTVGQGQPGTGEGSGGSPSVYPFSRTVTTNGTLIFGAYSNSTFVSNVVTRMAITSATVNSNNILVGLDGNGVVTEPGVSGEPSVPAYATSNEVRGGDYNIVADATGSTQGSNPISTYHYDFGDGNTLTVGNADEVSHDYAGAGSYDVELTVTDTVSLSGSDTQNIVV